MSEAPIVLAQLNSAAFMHDLRDGARLLLDLTRRDLSARYVSSVAGGLWLLVYPLLVCAIFVVFFQTIASGRGSSSSSPYPAVFILCGFAPFQFWSESLNRSVGTIVAVPSLVKNVVFPTELVCASAVLASLVQFAITLLLLFGIALWVFSIEPNRWMLTAPLMMLPLIIMVLGFAFFLAAAGVFFRDLLQVITLLTTVSMFFGPVFFSVANASEPMRSIAPFNPLTQPIEALRSIFLNGSAPDFGAAGLSLAVAIIVFVAGLLFFRSLSRDFADVL